MVLSMYPFFVMLIHFLFCTFSCCRYSVIVCLLTVARTICKHALYWLLMFCVVVYHLYSVMPRLVRFVYQLTNWYVRMNRRRLKVFISHCDPFHLG